MLATVFLFTGCTSWTPVAGSSPRASSQPAASPPAAASPEPSPSPHVSPSPPPLPTGTAVARTVLAPARVLPIDALCSYRVSTTADGNYTPTFCRGGAINVLAWRAYAPLSVNVMSLGGGATRKEVQTAMCRDMSKSNHATLPEEHYGYELSAAYYGWKFLPEPRCG